MDYLKFLSLLTGTIAAVVGIASETRNKETGKLTRAAWALLSFALISFSISIMLSFLEAREAERKARGGDQTFRKVGSWLHTA